MLCRPGDLFFCPSDWWHSTKVISAEPSVTLGGNFVDESNKGVFESKWRDYLNVQKLAAGGAASIEHGGKRFANNKPKEALQSKKT